MTARLVRVDIKRWCVGRSGTLAVGTTPVIAGCGCEQRQKEKKKENDGDVALGTHSFVGGSRRRRKLGTMAVWLECSIMDGEEANTG